MNVDRALAELRATQPDGPLASDYNPGSSLFDDELFDPARFHPELPEPFPPGDYFNFPRWESTRDTVTDPSDPDNDDTDAPDSPDDDDYDYPGDNPDTEDDVSDDDDEEQSGCRDCSDRGVECPYGRGTEYR